MEEWLLLSDKANRIADDFRDRCHMSMAQGVPYCDTGNVVEDRIVKVTPIEEHYRFEDESEARAVSTYLRSALMREDFDSFAVNVEPLVSGDGHHIHIHATWQ